MKLMTLGLLMLSFGLNVQAARRSFDDKNIRTTIKQNHQIKENDIKAFGTSLISKKTGDALIPQCISYNDQNECEQINFVYKQANSNKFYILHTTEWLTPVELTINLTNLNNPEINEDYKNRLKLNVFYNNGKLDSGLDEYFSTTRAAINLSDDLGPAGASLLVILPLFLAVDTVKLPANVVFDIAFNLKAKKNYKLFNKISSDKHQTLEIKHKHFLNIIESLVVLN